VWWGICLGGAGVGSWKNNFLWFLKAGIYWHTHTYTHPDIVWGWGVRGIQYIYRSPSTHTQTVACPGEGGNFSHNLCKANTISSIASTLISRSDQKKDWRKKKVIYISSSLSYGKANQRFCAAVWTVGARLGSIDPPSVPHWRSCKFNFLFFLMMQSHKRNIKPDGFVQSKWLAGVFHSPESQFKNSYQFRLLTAGIACP